MPNRVPETTGIPPDTEVATAMLTAPTDDEAYRQGWWAYSFGRSIACNPYPAGSEAYHHWLDGWADADEDCGD